jgi:hypothetical protein
MSSPIKIMSAVARDKEGAHCLISLLLALVVIAIKLGMVIVVH